MKYKHNFITKVHEQGSSKMFDIADEEIQKAYKAGREQGRRETKREATQRFSEIMFFED